MIIKDMYVSTEKKGKAVSTAAQTPADNFSLGWQGTRICHKLRVSYTIFINPFMEGSS